MSPGSAEISTGLPQARPTGMGARHVGVVPTAPSRAGGRFMAEPVRRTGHGHGEATRSTGAPGHGRSRTAGRRRPVRHPGVTAGPTVRSPVAGPVRAAPGAGGAGGGGAGGAATSVGTAGTTNRGGGAGGSGSIAATSAAGGSGILIIAISNTYNNATATSSNLVYAESGGNRIYTFNASGTFIPN